ncbi:DUF7009 family protein [Hymenobacter sp. BT491]|uniref:DUF7009 family protein n=1 Tax=Hymenobacter sp. BT491 TaxID=2766779 RepID=UPI001653E54C|nr:hypothetical protein [Hymenobacter sp. BT491]MBC6991298.1 hypothetical protein [Hymenobacter sp. BT491]
MKLRIEDNSVRLRLSDDEVQHFGRTGRVSSSVRLGPHPDDQLKYSLERLPEGDPSDTVRILYASGSMAVRVPAALAQQWVAGSDIGFSEKLHVTETQELRILVEKDLDCRH